MRSLRRYSVVCLLLVLLGSILPANAQARASWTILHYAAFDNDLETFIFDDLMEMRVAGSSPQVNLIAQIDRTEGYETRFGNWTDTRRFYLTQRPLPVFTKDEKAQAIAQWGAERGIATYDALLREFSAMPEDEVDAVFRRLRLDVVFDEEPLEVMGELDMSSAQTLAEFIAWGISNFPADKYMLVISSHGNGWAGIGPDYDSGGTILDLVTMQAGIRAGLDAVGVDKFDIIGFDACLMAQFEVATMLIGVARYLLAAEEVIPGRGWEYTTPYQALNANPNMDAFTLGKTIIDSYMDFYGGVGNRQKVDLHLVDLSATEAISKALNVFEQTAGMNLVPLLTALGGAWNNAQKFGGTAAESPNFRGYIDLRDFMQRLSFQTTASQALLNATQAVIDAVDKAVVYSRADDYLPGANGLSIYFPLNSTFYAAFGLYQGYPLVISPQATASWQGFLNAFHDTVNTQLNPDLLRVSFNDVITGGGNTVSIYEPPVLVMDVAGQGIVSLSVFAVWQLPNGGQIIVSDDQIARQIFFEFEGATYELLEYDEGRFQYTWDVLAPALTDGIVRVPILLQSRTTKELVISGVHRRYDGAESEATLVYDSNQQRIIGMVGQNEQGAPFEISPLLGDTFTPIWYGFDAQGNFFATVADASLDLSGGFPTLEYLPADNGEYIVGLRIEDLAGNVKFDRIALTVDNAGLDTNWRGYRNALLGMHFLYPFRWTEPDLFITEEAIPILIIGSPDDELYTIAITAYEAVSLADAKADSLARLEFNTSNLVVYDEVILTDFPYSPTAYEFEYNLADGSRIAGIRLFYDIPANNAVYIINLTVRPGEYANGVEIVGRLAQTISFFAPVPTD